MALRRLLVGPFDADHAVTVEVVDVLREPERALQDNIVATPTLVRTSPTPRRVLIGDLGRPADVAALLDLPEPTDE